jgi:hypothetical protein
MIGKLRRWVDTPPARSPGSWPGLIFPVAGLALVRPEPFFGRTRGRQRERSRTMIYQASGERDIWFAKIEGPRQRTLYLPCTSHYWVKRSGSMWIYDDEGIKWAEDPRRQMLRYAKEIMDRKLVCHTVLPPNTNGKWKRQGYDAVWEIIPDVVTDQIIRFSFARKWEDCDLSPRVPGYPISPDPAHR